MFRQHLAVAILGVCALAETVCAQVSRTIDFGRDVLPIFRQNCTGCHGPSQQTNGLRLDRRSSVFKSVSAGSYRAAAKTVFFITV